MGRETGTSSHECCTNEIGKSLIIFCAELPISPGFVLKRRRSAGCVEGALGLEGNCIIKTQSVAEVLYQARW